MQTQCHCGSSYCMTSIPFEEFSMSLNARRIKRVQKPERVLENPSGQVITHTGGLTMKPQEVKKPRPSRFEVEFERALSERTDSPVLVPETNGLQLPRQEDRIPLTLPKRADRRIRSAQRRLGRASFKAAKAVKLANLAHGDAEQKYRSDAHKASLKVTCRALQLAGMTKQAREIAKQHGLR